ncbi:hypothetical protein SUGI_1019000 [Cryptomeria japonica]|uniref:transcription factor WER n=1 Tax=Cryptomeria japonica TaxID=3369 RepID=UPI002414757B|nr:transcription factor WER [Cryptomeria japonica]XP_059069247.1 transcription factor WER [Cryptomeria japonica]GLJ48268.1 hypothetical protein SUGI_1019000 [Cryptomeria japonica]
MGHTPNSHSTKGEKKGPWTPEEDFLLTKYIETHGEGQWRTLPKKAGLQRCGKGCRLRWMNYLRPNVKRGNISTEEEDLIVRLHKLLGNRWSLIAGRVPGRTDNEIKNYWNTRLSRKLRNNGKKQRTDCMSNATEIFNEEFVDCMNQKHHHPSRSLVSSTVFEGSDSIDSNLQYFLQGEASLNINIWGEEFLYNPMDGELSQMINAQNHVSSSTNQQQYNTSISHPWPYLVGDLVSSREMPNQSIKSVDPLKGERPTISDYNDRDFMRSSPVFSDEAQFLSTVFGQSIDGFDVGNCPYEASENLNASDYPELLESCFPQFV